MASLALIRGAGDRAEVTLGMALSAVRFWEGVYCEAAGNLAVTADKPSRIEARRRLDVASARLDDALNRRDRLVAESQGLRWLWVARKGAE